MKCVISDWKKNRNGYGIRGGKYHHRIVWEQSFGEIPKGKVIRHSCDTPSCINVEHLLLGTQLENIQDREDRDRTAKGLDNGRTKMTPEIIKEVLKSKEPSRKIAARLGVSHTSVIWARNGKTTLSRVVLRPAPKSYAIGCQEDTN